jgi:DNA-binding MarR family transcriptional regulator
VQNEAALTGDPKMNEVPTSAAPTTAEAAFRSLIRTYGLLRRFMEPYFAAHGISASQWGVLRTIMRAEKEGLTNLRLTDLGERLLVRPPSVTGVVDRLERQGLVVRTASSTDLRTKYVSLTDTGRRLVESARDGHVARINAVLGVLSVGEQASLRGALERVADHLEVLADGAPPVAENGASQPDESKE